MLFVFGICLILIRLTCAQQNISSYRELSETVFNSALNCMSELSINIDLCVDIIDNECDVSDNKYDGCKCIMPCVGKTLGMMNVDDGKWNVTRSLELVSLLNFEPGWKQDVKITAKNCVDNVNTHCSAGYPLLQCTLKHSKLLQNMVKQYLEQKKSNTAVATDDADYEE